MELVMSTPNAKLQRTRQRKGATVATFVAAIDDSTAASRSSDKAAQDVTFSSNRNGAIPVNQKRDPKVGAATDDPIVLDNLPAVIPVTRRELEVIETFLGNLIDGLLLDAASDMAMAPLFVPNPGKAARASRPKS
jgi:hypothetical protein